MDSYWWDSLVCLLIMLLYSNLLPKNRNMLTAPNLLHKIGMCCELQICFIKYECAMSSKSLPKNWNMLWAPNLLKKTEYANSSKSASYKLEYAMSFKKEWKRHQINLITFLLPLHAWAKKIRKIENILITKNFLKILYDILKWGKR